MQVGAATVAVVVMELASLPFALQHDHDHLQTSLLAGRLGGQGGLGSSLGGSCQPWGSGFRGITKFLSLALRLWAEFGVEMRRSLEGGIKSRDRS